MLRRVDMMEIRAEEAELHADDLHDKLLTALGHQCDCANWLNELLGKLQQDPPDVAGSIEAIKDMAAEAAGW